MVKQGALTREEGAGELEGFRMPKLRFLLLSRCIKRLIFFHLDNETDFSTVAEIGDTKSAHFLNKGFPCELKLVLSLFNQVLNLVWL